MDRRLRLARGREHHSSFARATSRSKARRHRVERNRGRVRRARQRAARPSSSEVTEAAGFVQATYITPDTEMLNARANEPLSSSS